MPYITGRRQGQRPGLRSLLYRTAAISAVVMLGAAILPISSRVGADPNPICDDPSGLCTPNSQALPHYGWEGGATGAQWEDEFAGSTLNTSVWFPQDSTSINTPPGASYDAWWDTANVTVSSGELHLHSSYTTSETACNTYWGTTGCWVSGGIGQNDGGTGGEPWIADGQVAVDMKLTGTAIDNLDNVLQVGSYGVSWPPEIDYMENGGTNGTGNFYAHVHCGTSSSNNTQINSSEISSIDLTAWNVFELDWTSSSVKIYATPVSTGITSLVATITKPGSGLCHSDWPPAPASAMGSFLQQEMMAGLCGCGNTSQRSDHENVVVDWVAQQSSS